jgi:hypothetical protein
VQGSDPWIGFRASSTAVARQVLQFGGVLMWPVRSGARCCFGSGVWRTPDEQPRAAWWKAALPTREFDRTDEREAATPPRTGSRAYTAAVDPIDFSRPTALCVGNGRLSTSQLS